MGLLIGAVRAHHVCVRALQAVVEIPYVLVQGMIYGVTTYYMMQFDFQSKKVAWYLLFNFLLLLCEFCFLFVFLGGARPRRAAPAHL